MRDLDPAEAEAALVAMVYVYLRDTHAKSAQVYDHLCPLRGITGEYSDPELLMKAEAIVTTARSPYRNAPPHAWNPSPPGGRI